MTWEQAKGYCTWLAETTGEPWRLPTEAEWEKAARGACSVWGAPEDEPCAAATPVHPWGNAFATCAEAVLQEGGDGCGTGGTLPVGSRPAGASVYGAFDLAGNVWELCEDDYHGSYAGAPVDGSAWTDPPGPGVVFRGGSFQTGWPNQRSTDRAGIAPTEAAIDVGFRCVRSLP
jgi:formylglycine-generating enzyme required for sulfatase activity